MGHLGGRFPDVERIFFFFFFLFFFFFFLGRGFIFLFSKRGRRIKKTTIVDHLAITQSKTRRSLRKPKTIVTKFRNKDSKMKVSMVCSVVALFLAVSVWTQAAPVENGEVDFDSAKGGQRMDDAYGPECCTEQMIARGDQCALCYGGPTLPPNYGKEKHL